MRTPAHAHTSSASFFFTSSCSQSCVHAGQQRPDAHMHPHPHSHPAANGPGGTTMGSSGGQRAHDGTVTGTCTRTPSPTQCDGDSILSRGTYGWPHFSVYLIIIFSKKEWHGFNRSTKGAGRWCCKPHWTSYLADVTLALIRLLIPPKLTAAHPRPIHRLKPHRTSYLADVNHPLAKPRHTPNS
ncbi:hypothetical protein BC827DRAFT_1219384 [Russula dissimulans]|nr:hypothetical protein BC827DRAFT_1219384 [Russula dissimulans]